ncbi:MULTISPECIES: crotonase/enoyl-CoA hydratase family protein [Vreelandella]|jgi:enoyl-CoA hydratase/carnithine racemase|uniref:crotonase/enoyl-CoA hydratase family protein n=1 Tax=Vreelandella TaxID=3137766 RepID=UPI0005CBDBF4|nr:crotonase/enoyl-CoA hydratase family protein [Halomonas meridiana]KJD18097.1 enoyl-CoA hydratase [Halomonas meridiana]MCC4288882.1 crotonase/enoyl-CoA hydratase family protein [Halomonas meridiana]|tara:strand:- start:520 stop:1323 length:804 start_codon:yes stop_codon:yes gene_type:complete
MMALVTYEQDADGIVTLTLNDPETRNAISDQPMIEALLAALEKAEQEPDARVVVLTGAGTVFSSGGNIKTMGKGGGLNDELPARTRRNYRVGIQRLPLAFEALEIPVIAAVNGPAIGAGCDLTLMCDLRVAAQKARFAESFVKLGIVPGDGGAWLLPRVVGFSKACEMALTGDPVDAEEALRIGLVSSVVEDDRLLDKAKALAQRIAANPTHAVRMTKRLLRESASQRLDQILETSAAFQALAHATQDHQEAVAAMLEKRPPRFKGH